MCGCHHVCTCVWGGGGGRGGGYDNTGVRGSEKLLNDL